MHILLSSIRINMHMKYSDPLVYENFGIQNILDLLWLRGYLENGLRCHIPKIHLRPSRICLCENSLLTMSQGLGSPSSGEGAGQS